MQLFINNWASSLTLPATASAVQLSVAEADADLLVGLGSGDHYLLTLVQADGQGVEIAWEIVRVTGNTAGVLDVLRGQEGTIALDVEAGTAISARLTQVTMENLRDNAGPALSDATPQALGAAGAGTSPAASRDDHAHPMPSAADVGAATSAQGAKADSAVQPEALAAVATSGAYADLTGAPTIPTTAAEVGAIDAAEKGAALGVATLDAGGVVPAAQLPSYVDDVLEYADLASLPVTGETGKIYVTLDDSKQYRWSGSAYVQLVASPGTTDNVPEGSTNLYHTAARVRDALLTGLSLATSTAVTATDSVLAAIGKLAARLALKEQTLTAGSNVTIDRTDPDNPIISASITGGGGGDVVGPASAIANEVALFDGITGKLLKGGGVLGTAAAASTGDFATAAHVGAGGGAHANAASGGAAGFMTGADKAKLDGVASGATANPDTDSLAESGSPTNKWFTEARVRAALATGLSFADSTVIAATDSFLQIAGKLAARLALAFDRANHTGSQAISTVTGLQTALDGKAANPMTAAADLIVGGSSGTPARLAKGTALQVLRVNAAGTALEYADPAAGAVTQSIIVAASDETTALTTGTAKVTFRMPYAFTLTAVRASLTTAQTGGSILTMDINEGGTSILSTKLTIDNAEKSSTTAAAAPVISDASLADDAEITIDIDQLGDGTAKGLKVYLIGVPT